MASRSKAPTPSRVPRIGRPIGWSGQAVAVRRSNTQIVRRILDRADLLDDDVLLPFEFGGVELRCR